LVSGEGIISDNGQKSSGLIILFNGIHVDACERVILYRVTTGREDTECCSSRLPCRHAQHTTVDAVEINVLYFDPEA
jgi:hypothetical protein